MKPVARAPRFDVAALLLVFVGGVLGTTGRYLLGLASPFEGGLPVILTINVTGAFALGLLSPLLTRRRGIDWTRLNAFVATGLLGGYTTYGMFAVDIDGLLDMDRFAESLIYGLATVTFGIAAATAGKRLASRKSPAEASKR